MDKVLRLGIDPTAAEEGARRYRQATDEAAAAADKLRVARERNAAAAQSEGAAARVSADADRAAANYAYQLAAIRVAVANGTLNEAAATTQATAAQQRYNDALLRTLASNRSQIQASAEGRAVFASTAMMLESQGQAAEKAGVGTSRLARELITVTDRMAGFNPVAGQGLYILSQLATEGNGGILLGVVAGMAALAGVYALATREAREHKKATDDLVESLHKQAVARAAIGTTPTENLAALQGQRADLQRQISALEAQLFTASRGPTESGISEADVLDNKIARLKAQLDKLGGAADELDKQIEKQRQQAREDLTLAIQGQGRSEAIANARRDALRANTGADPDTLAKLNTQYDLAAKLADNLTKAEAARAAAVRDGNTALIALIEVEHRHADAAARSAAADALAALEAERLWKIRMAIASVSGARDVSGLVSPTGGGTLNQYGQYVPPSVAGRAGSTFYENTIRNPGSMTGGFYAPNRLDYLGLPSTRTPGAHGTPVGEGDFRPDTFGEWFSGVNQSIASNGAFQVGSRALGYAGLAQHLLQGTSLGNSGAMMALGGAASGAQLGAQVAGPMGAIVGAVGGFVKGLWDHAQKMKELAEAQHQFDLSIEARVAAAQGDTQKAAQLQQQAQFEKELAEARKAGMSKASIWALTAAQAEEKLAVARALAARQADFNQSLEVRRLQAAGQGDAASALQRQIEEEKQLADARVAGMTESQLATLKSVQAEEDLADARRKAADEAQKSADFNRSEQQRGFDLGDVFNQLQGSVMRAGGNDLGATLNDIVAKYDKVRQRITELTTLAPFPDGSGGGVDEAGRDTYLALARQAQDAEEQKARDEYAAQQLDKQLQAQQDQFGVLQRQLQVAQDALRAQQQTVDSLQRVYDSLDSFSKSLLVGSQSPLSPYDQLKEAGKQFFDLSAKAKGGDTAAAGDLQGSGQQYLGALRGYYASGAGYQQGFASVQGEINAVRDKYGQQLSVAQQQLGAAQQMVALAQTAADVAKQQLDVLQQQADILRGIATAQGQTTEAINNPPHKYEGPVVNVNAGNQTDEQTLTFIGQNTSLAYLELVAANGQLGGIWGAITVLGDKLDALRVAAEAAAVRR
jgi:hypothetical protein